MVTADLDRPDPRQPPHVLVGVDGSPQCRAALAWADEEAGLTDRRARQLVADVRSTSGLGAALQVPIEVAASSSASTAPPSPPPRWRRPSARRPAGGGGRWR
jgi:nucleotide-binding universal stress UspA family protein